MLVHNPDTVLSIGTSKFGRLLIEPDSLRIVAFVKALLSKGVQPVRLRKA
ncbi:MAG: hypothetical protein SOW06_08430 [Succinivibrionaceae bacterium]|nr:hypothetical protein [Succinivibrionaceae bacterium]